LRIYVYNLSIEVTEEELWREFLVFGKVTSAKIAKNAYDGNSRGFGFVEMLNISEGQAAITSLNTKVLKDSLLFCIALNDCSGVGVP